MFKKINSFRYVKNPSLRALLYGDALVLTASAMLAPIYALYVADIGGNIFGAGVTAAALAFGSGVMSLVAGRYIDQIAKKKYVLVFGYSVLGMGFLLFTQVDSIFFLAVVQLFIGLTRPFHETAFDALYSTHLDKSSEGREWGAWEATSHFTTAIGALLGSLLVIEYGFNGLFIAMAALCFVATGHVMLLSGRILQ